MEVILSLLSSASSFLAILSCIIPYAAVMTVIAIVGTRSRLKQARQIEANIKSGKYDNIQSSKETRVLGCLMLLALLLILTLGFGIVVALSAYYQGYLPTDEITLKYLQIASIFIVGLTVVVGIASSILYNKIFLSKDSQNIKRKR